MVRSVPVVRYEELVEVKLVTPSCATPPVWPAVAEESAETAHPSCVKVKLAASAGLAGVSVMLSTFTATNATMIIFFARPLSFEALKP